MTRCCDTCSFTLFSLERVCSMRKSDKYKSIIITYLKNIKANTTGKKLEKLTKEK